MVKIIKLDHLTKIEGHASLTLKIDEGKVKVCNLNSVEGSRYFEGIVRGRMFNEASEMTSRICGICSCAHVLASTFAVENALKVKVSEQTMQLRKLLNMGERIRSHATHLYFLSLPDFLGYESALAMVAKYKEQIKVAMNLMKLGNVIVRTIGGRDLHPVSVQVGGILKYPQKEKLAELKKYLDSSVNDAVKTIELFEKLKYPEYENPVTCFSVYNNKEYGMFEGVIRTHKKDYQKNDYHSYLKEYYERDCTSNFVVKEGKTYRVGALSRVNNSSDKMQKNVKKYLRLKKFPSHNPYLNNYAQALEILHCIEECRQIINELEIKEEKVKKIPNFSGHGIAAIEVPRGTLWHEYIIKNKKIAYCNIVTPTAQNLRCIQEDIRNYIPHVMNKDKKELVMDVEKLIRAYDPCFSCSTHFLDVKWV